MYDIIEPDQIEKLNPIEIIENDQPKARPYTAKVA